MLSNRLTWWPGSRNGGLGFGIRFLVYLSHLKALTYIDDIGMGARDKKRKYIYICCFVP